MMNDREIFEMVAAEIEKQRVTKSELAQKMNINDTSIRGMYIRKRIPFRRLMQLSEILNYNFLRVVAERMNISNPSNITSDNGEDTDRLIEEYQEKIQKLEDRLVWFEEMHTKSLEAVARGIKHE